ncbi:CHY zinc finger protein [Virgibacillus ndiopensis]|uniref:CHY zinc finger protein n=1 Tax=Virgibacillus ndiopensis TaxID=2004408 RepID=UPI000C08CCF4|nr:CHY zinc finger protein [Virgibacillus ndiopensis]
MCAHKLNIQGSIDNETRCRHYHDENDRIAIKFYCCGEYFPCYQCHAKYGCGENGVWPRSEFDQRAILCGSCDKELTINEYLMCDAACPYCAAAFNPGCSLHYHLYFERIT